MYQLELGPEALVAVGAALVAVLSLAFNWALLNQQAAAQRAAERRAFEAEATAWGFAALAALVEAASLARARNLTVQPADLRIARDTLATRLTILLDQARILFPEHPSGLASRRPLIREVLSLAYEELVRIDHQAGGPAEDAASFLDRCRRVLLAEQQRSADPQRRRFWRRRLSFVAEGSGRRKPEALDALQREFIERHGTGFETPALHG